MNFKKWIENNFILPGEEVDESQIDSIYDKAKYAVRMVRLYDESNPIKFLQDISTIANLSSGAYGLYTSSENNKIIDPSLRNNLRIKFKRDVFNDDNVKKSSIAVLSKYIPEVKNKIKPSDIIHVNVARILKELGDNVNSIIEIASTIIHEATHVIEQETTGSTNEAGPLNNEKKFKAWVKTNWNLILQRIPELKSI